MRWSKVITSSRLGPNRRHIGRGVGATILARLDTPDDKGPEVVVFLPMVEPNPKPRNPSGWREHL